jgi:thiol-disulfide isomerase/thioredoxin
MEIINQNSFLILFIITIVVTLLSLYFLRFRREISIIFVLALIVLISFFLIGFSRETEFIYTATETFNLNAYEKPMVVQVYSNFCVRCLSVKRMVDNLKSDLSDEVGFQRINIQSGKGHEFSKKYNVIFVPTFLIINMQGDIIYRTSGSVPDKHKVMDLIKGTSS